MKNFEKVPEAETYVHSNNPEIGEPGLYKVKYPIAVELNNGESQHVCTLVLSNRREISIRLDSKGAASSAIGSLIHGEVKMIPVSEFILRLESLLAELKAK